MSIRDFVLAAFALNLAACGLATVEVDFAGATFDALEEGAQALADGGFENSADNWWWKNKGPAVVDSTVAFEGGQSGRHDLSSAGEAKFWRDVFGVTPGERYSASVWLRTTGVTSRCELYLQFRASTALDTVYSDAVSGTNDWRLLTASGIAPAGTTRVRIQMRCRAGAGQAWWDGAWLVQGPLPICGNLACEEDEACASDCGGPVGGELLSNGGFEAERDSSDWWWNERGATAASSEAFNGVQSGMHQLNASGPTKFWKDIDASPGVDHTFSAWLRTEQVSSGCRLYLQWRDAGGMLTAIQSTRLRGTHDWTQVVVDGTSHADCDRARVQLVCDAGTGTAWWDDASLVQGVCDDCQSPECGDGTCNGNETCASCAVDCGECAPECGDGTCDGDETCSNCVADCGACVPECGDGTCNGTETCASCAVDCGQCAPQCGDGTCNGTETCASCAADCGVCPTDDISLHAESISGQGVKLPAGTAAGWVVPMDQGGVRGSFVVDDLSAASVIYADFPFTLRLRTDGFVEAVDARNEYAYLRSTHQVAEGEQVSFDFFQDYEPGSNRMRWNLRVSERLERLVWVPGESLDPMPFGWNGTTYMGRDGGGHHFLGQLEVEAYAFGTSYRGGVITEMTHDVLGLDEWPSTRLGPSGGHQEIVTVPGSRGSVLKFETRGSDPNTTTGGKRCEVAEYGRIRHEQEYYIGYRLMFDPSWRDDYVQDGPDDVGGFWNIHQLWDRNSPDNSFAFRGDHLAWRGPNNGYAEPMEKGIWIHMVLRHVPSYDADGLSEVWIKKVGIDSDYRKVHSYQGNTLTDDDEPNPWMKLGLYRWQEDPNTQIWYLDEYRRGVSFEAVDPDNY